MLIINPKVLVPVNEVSDEKLKRVERYGRVCYKSEDRITDKTSEKFVNGIISSGHESVIEHEKITVLIVTDRGISHEIVRHRIGSYSQESTRYCNYSKEQFTNQITFIAPFFFEQNSEAFEIWKESCQKAEQSYMKLLSLGKVPQEARSILPNSLKTELVVTYNLREWRHFFKLRCSPQAHPQMRQIAIPLLLYFQDKLPSIFEGIDYDVNFSKVNMAQIIECDYDLISF